MQMKPSLYKLKNGITVILDPMDIATTVVKVTFLTGSWDENTSNYGITHFCEHMLCKGTKRCPSAKQLKDYIYYNSGVTDACTGSEIMQLHGRIIAENVNVLIEFISEQLSESLFDETVLNNERNVICDELRRAIDNPKRQIADFISTTLFGQHFSKYNGLGSIEHIQSFTKQQLLEWTQERFSAKNCVIVVSGRISDTDVLLKYIEEKFAFLSTKDVEHNLCVKYIPNVIHKLDVKKENVNINILFPDKYAHTYEDIFNNKCVSIYEAFLNLRLRDIIRNQNGLVYGIRMTGDGPKECSLSGVETETSVENLSKTVSLISKTYYDTLFVNQITNKDIEMFNNLKKLGTATFLESSSQRSDVLLSYYKNHNRLYDFDEDMKISNSIMAKDVIEKINNLYDGEMSIITQGKEHDLDLKQIWVENFKA
ncbi:MAG: insulinase family protein [Alphaproteobacteria bacterium]|nr:insulinase family protein [Alphaproteobacteria bacterium]